LASVFDVSLGILIATIVLVILAIALGVQAARAAREIQAVATSISRLHALRTAMQALRGEATLTQVATIDTADAFGRRGHR
jgi:hypothetical protein